MASTRCRPIGSRSRGTSVRFRRVTILSALAVLTVYGLLIASLFFFFDGSAVLAALSSRRVLFSIQLSLVAATVATGLALLTSRTRGICFVALPLPWARCRRRDPRVPHHRLSGRTRSHHPHLLQQSPRSVDAGDHSIQFVFAFAGIVLAQFITILGVATRFMKTTFDQVPARYETMACTLGASPTRAFFTICLPLARRGIVASGVLAWAKAIGEFGATIMVAGTMAFRTETLPVAIFMRLSSADIEGTVALIIVLLMAIGLGACTPPSSCSENVVLRLDAVCAQAGTFRLKDISLSVAEGESHVLLGPSGAGKTTLLEVIIGLRRPTSGLVELAGRDLAGVRIDKRGMGYLPQRLDLFPHMTVRENIVYGPRSLPPAAGRVRTGGERSGGCDRHQNAPRPPPRHSLRRGTPAGGPRAGSRRPDPACCSWTSRSRRSTSRCGDELWLLLKALQAEVRLCHPYDHPRPVRRLLPRRPGHRADRWRGSIRAATATASGGTRPPWRSRSTLGIRNIFAGTVTGVEAHTATVDCPDLKGELHVPLLPDGLEPEPGTAVFVGIRAEFVVLRNADHPPEGRRVHARRPFHVRVGNRYGRHPSLSGRTTRT